jgi:predicted sugar kinase
MINDDEKFMKSLLDQLENQSWDKYMNLCYNVIVMFPSQVLQYDTETAQQRISSLDKIIEHFEEKEDFEKCAKLKEIQDQLKDC